MNELTGQQRRLPSKWTAMSTSVSRWSSYGGLGQRKANPPQLPRGVVSQAVLGILSWPGRWREGWRPQVNKPHRSFELHCCWGTMKGHKIFEEEMVYGESIQARCWASCRWDNQFWLGFLTSACVRSWGQRALWGGTERRFDSWIKTAKSEVKEPDRQKNN